MNVNAAGLNIVGDAANQPSIAVDPTAPNRMAIGWRQFGSVFSSFREAGRAYSRDGGQGEAGDGGEGHAAKPQAPALDGPPTWAWRTSENESSRMDGMPGVTAKLPESIVRVWSSWSYR